MSEMSAAPISALMDLVAGASLGAMFYGGLWWTVRRVATSTRPAAGVLISTLFRTGMVLGGFYLVGDGDWRRLLLCLARLPAGACRSVTWLTRLPPSASGPVRRSANGAHHAP